MKLYHDPISTTCRGILTFAASAGIALELVVVDLMAGAHRRAEFLMVNPAGLVPVLEDGDFRLTEGSAILKYLADRHGPSPAYPVEPRARARVNERMDWFNTGFYREFGYGLVYARVLREHYGWPDPAMQEALLARAGARAAALLDLLDGHMLAGPGPFLGGAAPDLSDYLGAAYASAGELIDFDFSPWPRAARWLAAMRGLPAWTRCNAGLAAWCAHIRGAAA